MKHGTPHSPDIVTKDDPVLKQVAHPVPTELFGSDKLKKIIEKMGAALHSEPHGVAIAAPQIGLSYRIFVVRGFVLNNKPRSDDDVDAVFINPVLVRKSKKQMPFEGEGCLSVPNVYGTTMRSFRATVRAQDITGKKFERGGSDLIAHTFQHELDHLDGTLFTDHATDLHYHEPIKEE